MRENTDQNNSEYGHFSRSVTLWILWYIFFPRLIWTFATFPVDTGRKLNVHKTTSMYVLMSYVSTGFLLFINFPFRLMRNDLDNIFLEKKEFCQKF